MLRDEPGRIDDSGHDEIDQLGEVTPVIAVALFTVRFLVMASPIGKLEKPGG